MRRACLVLLVLSLVTVAPTRALIGGCGGGRMGHMQAARSVDMSAVTQSYEKLAAVSQSSFSFSSKSYTAVRSP
jgi:hypothetical protein